MRKKRLKIGCLLYNQISPKMKAGEMRPYSYSGLLSQPMLSMLQKVQGLSAWCRRYPVLSPGSCFCVWFVSSLTLRGSAFCQHHVEAKLVCCFIHFGSHSDVLFCFSVYMLLGAKSTNLLRQCLSVVWSKICRVCYFCNRHLNVVIQVLIKLHTNKTKQRNVFYFLLNFSILGY